MESAHVQNCVGRCSRSHSDEDNEECVVAMHVPPFKGTAQVKFKVLDGTEPTLSMLMLVASEAKGETTPMMNAGNDWYLKVTINNTTEFIRTDVSTLCHTCPPNWVRNLSSEMKQRERCIVREQTARKDFDNIRKLMQLYLNSLMGTREMEIFRFLANPEVMDDAELPKDLRGLGRPPSFRGKDAMQKIQQWIRQKRPVTYKLPGIHE